MKVLKETNAIRLYFPERITSANAAEVGQEAAEAAAGTDVVIIDLADTVYISSAGLRILLGLKKSGHTVRVENVSLDVYEILDTTGFTEILSVTKRRRQISLEGAVQIGSGYSADVYQLDGDTIVKVFIHEPTLEDVQRELNLAKKAFVLGIPTAISYDVVDVNGRLGVVFELLGVGTLKQQLVRDPDSREEYIGKYIRMMKTINTTDAKDTTLPHGDTVIRDKLNLLKDDLTPEEYARMSALLDTIPRANTFVHGDCHVKNVMISDGELLMIDMDTLSAGYPLYELAAVYGTYEMFERVWPGNNEDFLGIDRAVCQRIVERLLWEYFTGLDEAAHRRNELRICLTSAMTTASWMKEFVPQDNASRQTALTIFREYLPMVDDLVLERL